MAVRGNRLLGRPALDSGEAVTATGWQRLGLGVLLVGTAVFYLWNITINGMGNQFYAAAAQAGSKNWEALLFGSLDSSNFITVDKPPVSQWVMGLSGQIFGFSSASMMIPQALMAVASVALLYGAVTRISGRNAGLLAGAALALTPVAVLMFRFNNPDAVMVLLMMVGAYCTVRALERASATWIALAGAALGFAFLAKMLEGLMVLPALGIAYLIAAPTPLGKRLLHSVGALVALLVASGWYVVLTLLWPAPARPYLAGSTDNNFMNLVLGYNGFARVLGRNHPGGGGPGGGAQHMPTPPAAAAGHGASAAGHAATTGGHGGGFGGGGFGGFGGQTRGLSRLFTGEFGYEIGWLIPAALLGFVLVLISRGRAPRTDLVRAGAIVFGGWLLVDGLVLSYMKGTIHPYYCLSLAPGVAGMAAIAAHEMWSRRESWFGRAGMSALVLTAGGWGFWILRRNSGWFPELRWIILALTVVAAAALLISWQRSRSIATIVTSIAIIAALGGSTAYAVATVGQPHLGGGPTVGPQQKRELPAAFAAFAGMFGQGQDNPQLDAMLRATDTKWSAAMDRSSSAAALELPSNTAIMAIGGFSGSDPAPTLQQFQTYVHDHDVTYYIVQNRGGRGGQTMPAAPTGKAGAKGRGGQTTQQPPVIGSPASVAGFFGRGHSDIADWVTSNFTPTTVGSATVYNLTQPKS
ncbi:ArnT family glycosyltransferase [Antrihabitans cavernicola]|uniref:Glycosyltransferase family 39 protein n=1 Tax=Antrihabitans cavernicola TaxID=2495913 RepID=A0A5A7SGY7_9NOCA|nr:glycosyltransferase family 39 protein [Spelaeibacter cavernicola]KAA0023471.1 glycosyltransferase family 39 protein [Spelaeibacter cavernicola]